MTYRLIEFFLLSLAGNLIFLKLLSGTFEFNEEGETSPGTDFHFRLEKIQFAVNKSQLDAWVSSKKSEKWLRLFERLL